MYLIFVPQKDYLALKLWQNVTKLWFYYYSKEFKFEMALQRPKWQLFRHVARISPCLSVSAVAPLSLSLFYRLPPSFFSNEFHAPSKPLK